MRKLHQILTLALLGTSGMAGALPLDTGYDHANFQPYPSSAVSDNYWIKIASYAPSQPSASVAPASIINAFLPAGPNARVLGPNPSAALVGTQVSRKGYSLYRKCFCLLTNKGASLQFNVRGDDVIQVWLNTVMYTLAGPGPGNWWTGSSPVASLPTNESMFLIGRNCIYVLVEDFHGATYFSLAGQVTGPGVMPMAAEGVDMVFKPCHCPQPPGGAAPTGTGTGIGTGTESESARVESIIQAARVRAATEAAAPPRAEESVLQESGESPPADAEDAPR